MIEKDKYLQSQYHDKFWHKYDFIQTFQLTKSRKISKQKTGGNCRTNKLLITNRLCL